MAVYCDIQLRDCRETARIESFFVRFADCGDSFGKFCARFQRPPRRRVRAVFLEGVSRRMCIAESRIALIAFLKRAGLRFS